MRRLSHTASHTNQSPRYAQRITQRCRSPVARAAHTTRWFIQVRGARQARRAAHRGGLIHPAWHTPVGARGPGSQCYTPGRARVARSAGAVSPRRAGQPRSGHGPRRARVSRRGRARPRARRRVVRHPRYPVVPRCAQRGRRQAARPCVTPPTGARAGARRRSERRFAHETARTQHASAGRRPREAHATWRWRARPVARRAHGTWQAAVPPQRTEHSSRVRGPRWTPIPRRAGAAAAARREATRSAEPPSRARDGRRELVRRCRRGAVEPDGALRRAREDDSTQTAVPARMHAPLCPPRSRTPPGSTRLVL